MASQRVENRIEIRARPEAVFRAIANPAALPEFAPGIDEATLADVNMRVGSRLALRTPGGRALDGRIVERKEARRLAVEDARGIRTEWRLFETPEGRTLATNVIKGPMSDDQAKLFRVQALEKIMRLARQIESEERLRGRKR